MSHHTKVCRVGNGTHPFCTADCDCDCHGGHEHLWSWIDVPAYRGPEPCNICEVCRIIRCETTCPEHDGERCNRPRHHRGPHRWDCLLSLGLGRTYRRVT